MTQGRDSQFSRHKTQSLGHEESAYHAMTHIQDEQKNILEVQEL